MNIFLVNEATKIGIFSNFGLQKSGVLPENLDLCSQEGKLLFRPCLKTCMVSYLYIMTVND